MGIQNGIRLGSVVSFLLYSRMCRSGLWTATELWLAVILREDCCLGFLGLLFWGDDWWHPTLLPQSACTFALGHDVPHLGDIVLHQMLIE